MAEGIRCKVWAVRSSVLVIAILISLLRSPLSAAMVRVSFLTEKAALQNTLDVLRRSRCTEQAAEGFRRAVERYSAAPIEFDFKDKADLITWLVGMYQGAEKNGRTHCFATFNDAKIEPLEFLQK